MPITPGAPQVDGLDFLSGGGAMGQMICARLVAQTDRRPARRIVLPCDSPIRRTLEVSDGGAELLTLGDG